MDNRPFRRTALHSWPAHCTAQLAGADLDRSSNPAAAEMDKLGDAFKEESFDNDPVEPEKLTNGDLLEDMPDYYILKKSRR